MDTKVSQSTEEAPSAIASSKKDPFATSNSPTRENIPTIFDSEIEKESEQTTEKESEQTTENNTTKITNTEGYSLGRGLKSSDINELNKKEGTIKSIASFLKSKLNLPNQIIASIIGNMYAESGIDFGIEEKANTKNKGYGLLQFTGDRRNSLERYARDNGKHSYDPTTQLNYLVSEIIGDSVWTNGGSYHTLSNLARTNKSIEEVNTYLLKTFIRPAKNTANLQLRIDASNYINQLLN